MITEMPERGFVKVDGHRFGFARTGRGRSIVLLHGIPNHRYLWRNVTPLLVAAGLNVLTIDLLGYGASDKPAGVDLGIASQAHLLVKAFNELNWPGGTIAGHDIGGGVAQLLAVKTPDVASRLILIDTIAYDSFPEPGDDQFQPLRYGERLAKAMPNARFEVVERAGHFLPEDAPETLAYLIANFVRAEDEVSR